MLGLLDLYGFEDGDGNGFEQLLINFSNERVHQVLIELTFKEEQQEYVQEGLEWTSVAFSDNLIICDLIRKVRTEKPDMVDYPSDGPISDMLIGC